MTQMKATKYRDLKGNIIRSDNPIVARPYMHGPGCRDDFYNGNNPLNVSECWGFKSASVVDKIGHANIHVANGPNTIMCKTLSCWNAVSK